MNALFKKINRLTKFVEDTQVNMMILVPTLKDQYRKVKTAHGECSDALWTRMDELFESLDLGKSDREASFYVGDAAGRPQDHGDGDRMFAQAGGVAFYTEQWFAEGPNDCK